MTHKYFELNKEIVVKIIEEEAVIVFVENAMIMSLNSTGTFVIEYLSKSDVPVSFDELLNGITNKFDITIPIASIDLQEFLAQLKNKNLIHYN